MYIFLPQSLDLEGVLADDAAGALLERVLDAALADAGQPGVGLHRDDHVALIERLVQTRRQ
jgi:hypothetical protein